jgi:hypothetical protein
VTLPGPDCTIEDMDMFHDNLVLFLRKNGSHLFCSIDMPIDVDFEVYTYFFSLYHINFMMLFFLDHINFMTSFLDKNLNMELLYSIIFVIYASVVSTDFCGTLLIAVLDYIFILLQGLIIILNYGPL